MPFDLAIIDLDNTLYAANNGVFARMDIRMTAFVARELSISTDQANHLRKKYWQEYGTTLRGLMLHHNIQPEPFLCDVHDICAHEILEKDTHLEQVLQHFPGRKIIHTNSIHEHAERILNILGIAHHFQHIYDIRFNHYTPKPCKKNLNLLLEHEKTRPERAIVIDDMEANLHAAKQLGIQTALIGQPSPDRQWHYHASSFHQLGEQIS